MTAKIPSFKTGDLLLVIDVQKDFCPGGALPIEKGDEVVPVLNTWMRTARDAGAPVYLSRDWHPKHHMSFEQQGGKWPPHCVQDTDGARFHPHLETPLDAEIVTKGTRFDQDQNSAFDQTGLANWLHQHHIKRIFVGGLAQDVCVLATVLDGRKAGFEMQLIEEATRPVTSEGGQKAIEDMREAGAKILKR
ncbi:nicotinamidase/pyrazinamidase [Geoalkalibacter ferrihydriticus]|uniref:nicotinamidase n=2 Tax=Geoalkalibacter ferrihydriticus TaxID=392333 RepID=A0A0C2HQT6_9BACT|nr:nicotinamidase [Geoalkalibacter ferrihydriticus]KIH77260.1 isochorismatase [Geoalkalibacter ferrihydriticus DSM 17813]SDM22822.1 nicotinamidase/pyrazinamidase [Geoalkalibacter ferrihydriticus]